MGEPAQRFGDANSGGGTIGAVTNNEVYVNNKLISIDGSIVYITWGVSKCSCRRYNC